MAEGPDPQINSISVPDATGSSAGAVRSRIMRAIGAGSFRQIVNLVVQLLTVPLFLHVWGKSAYGEWLILTTVPTYFSMSDLGFGDAAGSEMTLRAARQDYVGAIQVFQSTWLLISAISLVLLVICGVALPHAPVTTWFHLEHITPSDARWVVCLLTLQTILSQQGCLFAAAYKCTGNFTRNSMVRTIEFAFSTVLLAIALLAGWGPVAVAGASLAGWTIGNWLIYLDTTRLAPWLRYGYQHARLRCVRTLIAPALALAALPLASSLTLQGMVLVIGATLGPIATIVFSTSRTLSRVIWQIINALTNPVWAELSMAFGRDDIALARTLHRRVSQLALWIGILCGGGLLLVAPLIFSVWTHNKIHFDYPLFTLMVISTAVFGFWSASNIVTLALNRHGAQTLAYLILSVLSIPLAIISARTIGIRGVGVTLIVVDVIMALYVIPGSLKYVDDHWGAFLKAIASPPTYIFGRILSIAGVKLSVAAERKGNVQSHQA